MRKFVFTTLLLFSFIGSQGQSVIGFIADGETNLRLSGVVVTDLVSGMSVSSGAAGFFDLPVARGSRLSFSLAGYHTLERLAANTDTMHIVLLPISVQLPEYTLHELTPFQRDSIEMATLYEKELNKKKITPKITADGGLVVSGLIGAPVQRMSRSYKQNKKFKAAFKKDMEQKFIDTRYKPELVTSLTGLTGDSLISFMNSHPMDYSFARAATDLEIKAWIRETFHEFLSPKKEK